MKVIFQNNNILPVIGYGGAERIMFWHMMMLAKLGHEVVLIGNKNCSLEKYGIELVPMLEGTSINNFVKLIPKDADIIHLPINYIPPVDIPTVVTVHGNGQVGEQFPCNSVFVSKKHASIHGSDCYIHNALDFDDYPFEEGNSNTAWNNFLFLGKGSWSVKNLKDCIKACKKAKKTLHIAGGRSLIPSRYIKSYGIVGGEKKSEIINKCDALVFPVRWHEPFGLAIIEAWAQGLPVIGSSYGSLPELITPMSGIICNSFSEFVDVLERKENKFNRAEIRKYVESRFSISDYTNKYIEIYKKVISGEKLNNKKPELRGTIRPENLFPF